MALPAPKCSRENLLDETGYLQKTSSFIRMNCNAPHQGPTKTGYQSLDGRIAKTMGKKSELLMALKCPKLPLHNNDAELGMRSIAEGSESTGSQTRCEPA